MTAHAKISSIEQKIKQLEEEKGQLLQKRAADLSDLFLKLDLSSIPDDVLVGALLSIKESLSKEQNPKEEWQLAGRKFLKSIHKKERRSSKNTLPKKAASKPQKQA